MSHSALSSPLAIKSRDPDLSNTNPFITKIANPFNPPHFSHSTNLKMFAPAQTTVSISGNKATIAFAAEIQLFKQFLLSSHTTRNEQIIRYHFDDADEEEYRLTDQGRQNNAVFLPPFAKTLTLTFSYKFDGGQVKTSKVRSGGPYSLDGLQSIMLAVENGDDVDYNDVIAQIIFK